ncbi:Yos1-like protein [Amylostereum chailletii]|nr:Yos1-like protein [Amylostereum chailletii]
MYGIGSALYITILLINAMAVLSEDRFLARIGWSSVPPPNANAGFGSDVYGGGAQDIGVKGRIINLISAVRTLMRSMYMVHIFYNSSAHMLSPPVPLIGINLVVIVYELILGS